jgi:PAS domain S-box-containing protein
MKNYPPSLTMDQLLRVFSLAKPATAVHVGEDATVVFANEAMLAIWGKSKNIIGMPLVEALPELKGQPFLEMFSRVWNEGLTLSGNDTPADLLVGKEIQTFYFDFEYRAVKDENGAVIAILHTATDVTERFLNREELEAAKRNKELLLREQSLNEELAASNEELSAMNEELSRSREELSSLNLDLETRVTERVKAFTESEERFRSMAENTDVLIAVGDESGKKFYFNKAWSELTGRSAEQLISSGWDDLIYQKDRPTYLEIHRTAFENRVSYTDEFRVLGADGTLHWLLKKGTPRFLSDGTFAGYISSCIDITKRKQDEQKMQELNEELAASNEELSSVNEELAASNEELAAVNEEFAAVNEELAGANEKLERSYAELLISENRFRSLIIQAPVAICVIRATDLMVLEVNDSYLELVGKKRREIENHTIWDAVAEAADSYAPVMQQVVNSGIAFHAREHEVILIRNGKEERLFIDFVYEPVHGISGEVTLVLVVGNDVTDKVIARRNIEDVEERIRLAIEAAEIGTYDYNYKTDLLTSSERFNQIFGFEDGEISRARVLQTYHPDDVGLSAIAHEAAKDKGKLFYEARFILADGSLHWARCHGKVYFSSDGSPERVLGTVLDITEHKRLQQQKDDFISIASHELKTPITSLKASLQLLERMEGKPSPLWPKLISQSVRSMKKISELVEDLLNVSRMKEGQVRLKKEQFPIERLLHDCCAHVRQTGTHELILQGDLDLKIIADEHRIEQVIVNLLNNAIKYAPKERKIFITVENMEHMAKISVRDTGPGIYAEKQPHLFERYFRADESGAQVSGLGLGLYISADIISRHGGEIGVDSVPGEGSNFWFTLPKN